ncbi:MAG: hypothetical protein K2Y37_14720 [Pirellulales bacterium]|nr:hypothetical protein [Pirellulales bacterium]
MPRKQYIRASLMRSSPERGRSFQWCAYVGGAWGAWLCGRRHHITAAAARRSGEKFLAQFPADGIRWIDLNGKPWP